MLVHPHAYGERGDFGGAYRPRAGSSPRIWGTAAHDIFVPAQIRFIPTHMGNGAAKSRSISSIPVHPHAYGERQKRVGEALIANGSSPRIWGTGQLEQHPVFILRFIPTHMGNGSERSMRPNCGPVHPHAYGERTSPHDSTRSPTRFIPTHMGNGVLARREASRFPVHPHAYGERRVAPRHDGDGPGSSPRIWGTVTDTAAPVRAARFIPTHMGNGRARSICSGANTVHPHAYGERAIWQPHRAFERGSSPRIWGTGNGQLLEQQFDRFIPTHMGNGCAHNDNATIGAVHPHAYGERHVATRNDLQLAGSSPRIWGTVSMLFALRVG